jgi:hypothetical protein
MNISEQVLSVTATAWAPAMAPDEYGAFLNTLLEAERAGAKLLDAQVTPSAAVGDFHGRGLAIEGWRERLRFLNRGQAWVAKRIAAALPRVPDRARPALQAMLDSRVAHIATCETLL